MAAAGWSDETAALLKPKYRLVLNGVAVEPSTENLQEFMTSVLQQIKVGQEWLWPLLCPVLYPLKRRAGSKGPYSRVWAAFQRLLS